jgi:hypothetical protein
LNHITLSSLFEPKDLHNVLEALVKVEPAHSLSKLKFNQALNSEEHLRYFENIDLPLNVLVAIQKLFDVVDPARFLEFLYRKSNALSSEEQLKFFSKLLRQTWFNDYISTNKVEDPIVNQMAERLEYAFLNREDLELHERMTGTLLHFMLATKTYRSLDRLRALDEVELNSRIKAGVRNNIIASLTFQEIADVLDYLEYNHESLFYEYADRIMLDFGIPPVDIRNQNVLEKLFLDLDNLGMQSFYRQYLDKFGVDYKNDLNGLDFEKIAFILNNEQVESFVHFDGKKRDYFVYPVVKLLEFTFDSSLGFHDKLYENQYNKQLTVSKRAEAWANFIESNGLKKTPISSTVTSK